MSCLGIYVIGFIFLVGLVVGNLGCLWFYCLLILDYWFNLVVVIGDFYIIGIDEGGLGLKLWIVCIW